MKTFGRNEQCQLGLGFAGGSYNFPQNTGITNAVAVATGTEHQLALLDDGSVLAWGHNANGCCGVNPTTTQVCAPTEVNLPGCAVAISAGGYFSLALLANGTIYAWGDDVWGQLGNGSTNSTGPTPVQVSGITTAVAIATGGSYALALLDDGTVRAWGYGVNGQLGNGASTSQSSPVQVVTSSGNLTNVVKIDAGAMHSVALRSDNTVYTWGYSFEGRLGIGAVSWPWIINVATYVSSFSSGTTIDVEAGTAHTVVLKSDGSTKACGNSSNKAFYDVGNLCNLSGNYLTPVAGPTVSGAADISIPPGAAYGHIVKSNGQIYGWGDNQWGTVGVSSGSSTICPMQLVNNPGTAYYCPAKPSSSNTPQPCCVAVLDDNRTVIGTNNGNVTFNTSQTYNSLNMAIFGTVTLNGGTHTFTSCDVVMGKDAKIIVNYPAQLVIQTGSHFYACSDMWDGIEVNNRAIVQVKTSSIIEDAEIAVDIEYGASYTLNNATFNRNFTHVRKTMPSSGTPYYTGDYRIVQCKFKCHDIPGIGGIPDVLLPPRAGQRTNVAIHAMGVPKILVGNTLANANTMDNSDFGVFTSEVTRVEVRFNTIRDLIYSGVTCWFGTVTGTETIWISRNTLQRMPIGIYCYDNPRATIKIDTNTITFAGMVAPPLVMVGITVEEITPGNSTYPNKLRIVKNNIQQAPSGIRVANLFGNVWTSTTYVGENTITQNKNPSYTDGAGILMQNVSGVIVKGNNVSGASGINWWEHGIRSDGTTNMFFCDTVHHIGNGFSFDGDNRPSTLLVRNIMNQNSTGIWLNNGIIGAQGTSASMPNDNIWTITTAWGTGNPHIMSDGSGANGNLSPFVVRSPGAEYYPQYREDANSGVEVPIPSITAKTWTQGCLFSAPSYKTGEENPMLAEALDMVAEATEVQELMGPLTDRQRSIHWAGQFGLYRQLLMDEELRHADDALNAYFTEQDGGNIGKLHRAMDEFQAIRANNVDGYSAENMSLVGGITSDLLPEQRLAEVMSILHANIADLTMLSEQDEKRLEQIAQMCPLDEGFAVHIARAALQKLDSLPKHYFSDCGAAPSPEEYKTDGVQDNEPTFRAYPNPNNGSFQLDYFLLEKEKGSIEIHDAIGRLVVSQQLLPESNHLVITLDGENEGLYILSVRIDGQLRYTEKMNVTKQ